MGAFTSKTEEDLKLYLQNDYDIINYPTITHKNKKYKAIVHQIITDSTEQAQKIRTDVNTYHHIRCQSISKILDYIPLQSDKICSEQEYHYIVQQDLQKYNLQHQFRARKYYKQKFSDHQILSILKTLLCALSVYHQKFQRKFQNYLSLQSITVDEHNQNQLRLVDPILRGQSNDIAISFKQKQRDKNSDQKQQFQLKIDQTQNKILIKEAPQRRQIKKIKFNQNKIDLNQFLADLYQVGILCLQLHRMQFFKQYQKSDILTKQISSISNRQIKKIIQYLTSSDFAQRAKTYDLIKVSANQKYSLQKNFKTGKYNKNSFSHDQNLTNHNKLLDPTHLQKISTSFSFGNWNSQAQHLYKKNQSFEFPLNQQQTPIIKSFNLDSKKVGTMSNMSTDRSLHPTVIVPSNGQQANNKNRKPIIKFNVGNNSTSDLHMVKIFSYNSQNILPNIQNKVNNLPQNNSTSNLPKQMQAYRTNSYFICQNVVKPLLKQSQYSPFKKQENISPISQKEYSPIQTDTNNYQQIFKKYPYLNYQSSSKYSPYKNDKLQAQIDRLLKGHIDQNLSNQIKTANLNKKLITNQNINLSPIGRFNSVESPINALQGPSSFALKQNNFSNVHQKAKQIIEQENSAYRPNKEVEQILKRLGIGSLLYGNNQTNLMKEQTHQKAQINQTNFSQQNKTYDVFVHKLEYNINQQNVRNQLSNDSIKTKKTNPSIINQNAMEDIENRQTTPIRPVIKAKYNSTIVQVRDQDSQFSSSGVRNLSNFEQTDHDLQNHQFVNQQYETGSRYQGYKLNGERNGYGKFFYQDGGYYQGQWKNNKMDGFGKLYYEGGKLAYEGHWAQDQFHGFGKVYNDNPVKLQCGFDFTNFDLLQDYWEYYEGMLVKDTKQGRGRIKLTNDQIFEGDFHNDRIQGFGKFFLRQGSMIEGIWRDSKLIKIIN